MKLINSDNFEQEVIKSELPVLVDFFATWCGPCKMLGPVLESVAQQYEGKAKVVKVDIDESPELAQQFRISAVPTLFVVSGGNVVSEAMGFQSKKHLAVMLDQAAAAPTN